MTATTPTRIGLSLPQLGAHAGPDAVSEVAVAAERLGFDSLWAMDRLLAPVQPRNDYPPAPDGLLPPEQRRVLDPLACLTFAAAVTERIRIGTSVLVAPWYPPVLLARSLTTLDHLSRGRLTVGFGVGWSEDEYEAVGATRRAVGNQLDETLDVLEAVWTQPVVEHHGTQWDVPASTIEPKPVQGPRPPLLLAAYTPSAMDRVARRADGWTPAGLPIEAVAPMFAVIRDLSAVYGRDPDALQLVVRANIHLTDRPIDGERASYHGSLEQVAEDLDATRATGADEIVLDLQTDTRCAAEQIDLAARLTERSVVLA
ncbi:TIGR03619 family F420-dependent LLM class oxidoreductase [soil metagenome]